MIVTKALEALATRAAGLAWTACATAARHGPSAAFQPPWASAPLPKSWQKSSPELGWPRTTDSLCPICVKEARARILSGIDDYEILRTSQVGEIKATILERDGEIQIEKTCPTHGTFTDTLAIDPAFQRRIEDLFPGRDLPAVTDTLHNHGTSSIKWGRGSVLTIDLTNRCNMMCDPCFMDANQVGYVHELTLDEVKQLLDDAITIKPKRQMSVQFSGGEPTLSPIFLESVAYARAGRLLQRPGGHQRDPLRAGPRLREARPGMPACGSRICSSTASARKRTATAKSATCSTSSSTRSRTCRAPASTSPSSPRSSTPINNDQVGPIIKFAVENCEKISFVSFQPVSFTGRDEDIDDSARHRRRYTLSHLARDVKTQTGSFEPLRDWFPLSAAGAFADVTDVIQGPGRGVGHDEMRLPSELRNRCGVDD